MNEIVHEPTVSEFRRMAEQLGYEKVVRCRSCRFYDGNYKYPVCILHDDKVNENDFCSKGEERL